MNVIGRLNALHISITKMGARKNGVLGVVWPLVSLILFVASAHSTGAYFQTSETSVI